MNDSENTVSKSEAVLDKDQPSDESVMDGDQLQIGKEAFKKAFKDHGAVMYVVDMASFFIVAANNAALKFYGYDRATMLTKRIPDLNIASEPEIRTEIKNAVDEGRSYYVFKHRLSSGELRDVEIYANPISIQGKNYSFSIVHDITDRLLAEEAVKKSKQDLQEANNTKDKFFSIIAHDLKNPLGSFRDLTNLMNDSYNDFTEKDMIEFIAAMNQSSNQLYNLLENLLQWSRSQTGNIEFTPVKVDMCMLLFNNIDFLKKHAEKKGINLRCSTTEEILGFVDVNMISTVIGNLTSNAIKFTPENGEIALNAIDSGDFVEVSITDNGVGISKENILKLFRIDVSHTTLGTSDEKGTGLGLILCKEFVEKNGGKIWVESKLGKGTTFKFTLPKG